MHYSLKRLQSLPTLHQGQCDDLKIETNKIRVWLSRLTKADGMPYDNQVTIEEYKLSKKDGYTWQTVEQYQAK